MTSGPRAPLRPRAPLALALACLALWTTMGCTVGQGEGWVRSELLAVPECWHGAFDLQPNFFAAGPYRDTLQIRVQRGSDLTEVSDGVAIQVNAVTHIRDNMLGQEVSVGLPPELWNEVNPSAQPTEEPLVNLGLYLEFSCHNQNTVLYATDGVIVFNELFSGDPNETSGDEKLTEGSFDVTVGNPRDAPAGSTDIPQEQMSRVTGYFRFHFQRGQPGQPFP